MIRKATLDAEKFSEYFDNVRWGRGVEGCSVLGFRASVFDGLGF